ncbi:MAG: hypothetical protein WDN44_05545 [Sphingomonas sp.]
MTGWLMRRMPPGGFAWLVLHELRLARRSRSRKSLSHWLGWLLLLAWIAGGVMIALALRHVTIPLVPKAFVIVAAGLDRHLHLHDHPGAAREPADALRRGRPRPALLRADPAAHDRLGQAGRDRRDDRGHLRAADPALVLPAAILGHPELFGIPALLAALALAAACLGLAVTLAIARIAGPRAARTFGQVVAALSAGAVFLVSQLMGHGDENDGGVRRSGWSTLFAWMEANGFGEHGVAALPGRAAFGDPIAIALLLGGARRAVRGDRRGDAGPVPRGLSRRRHPPLAAPPAARQVRAPFPPEPVRRGVREGMAAARARSGARLPGGAAAGLSRADLPGGAAPRRPRHPARPLARLRERAGRRAGGG